MSTKSLQSLFKKWMNAITVGYKAKHVRRNMGPLFCVLPQKQISIGNESDALKNFVPNCSENADVFLLLFLIN